MLAIVEFNNVPCPPVLGAVKLGVFHTSEEKKVVGQYEINLTEVRNLRDKWSCKPITFLCGADGGWKDGIGTSGYVVTTEHSDQPIVTGHAAEGQREKNASSTRQELLGQLAIEYWVTQLIQTLGEPGWDLQAHVVIDSQASIDKLDRCKQLIGIKDVF